ncbi:hypothetical protein ADU59_07360 [Pararhizobium polonicum]|uniref:Uncharacterized protein n=1 Tax=Pararhizobium polonicum TaxID=1612624 RepID=A0A1C7P4Q3_9HYPH|nr:hypothetical protein ADU59_07360 [Pararhizobium polonicum]
MPRKTRGNPSVFAQRAGSFTQPSRNARAIPAIPAAPKPVRERIHALQNSLQRGTQKQAAIRSGNFIDRITHRDMILR